ncbi:MAG: hypothetical protein ABH877_04285 [bacterium]
MRYVYLGDRLTDPRLVGEKCDPVRRADGKCIKSLMATQLVHFASGEDHVVLARRLRVQK